MKITYLPRYHVGRRWSPEEILAVKLPSDIKEKSRKRAATASIKAIADGAEKRKKKKADRKKRVLSLIATHNPSTTDLLSLMGEKINRTTIYALTEELRLEGFIHKIGRNWKPNQITNP